MEDKKSIRKDLITKRDAVSNELWNQDSMAIQRTLLQSDIYKKCDCLLSYADYHGEVGTLMLVEDALMSGKRVFLPKVLDNFTEARMEFYEIFSTNELISGYKGIPEPTGNRERTFDYAKWEDKNILMTVPGVAFSKDNYYRLGYGLGYYDRYLEDKPAIVKCGLCFSMQVKDEVPVNETDIRMDFLVTEETTLSEINDTCKVILKR